MTGTLTMRPTGLSSPAYKDEYDVVIYDDGEAVGRIGRRDRHARGCPMVLVNDLAG
jgi:hypothetical protein